MLSLKCWVQGMDDVGLLSSSYQMDSYLFFVDSALRDKTAYQTPSQYTLTFDKPFTNVVGLDLLQATIPRTEYLLDHDSNTFAWQIDAEPWQTLVLDPGDYNINQLMTFLSSGLTANGKSIAVTGVSTILEIKSQLKFKSIYPFSFNMTRSTMRAVLGFSNPLYAMPLNYSVPAVFNTGDEEIFSSKLDMGNVNAVTTFAGPTPILTTTPLLAQPTSQQFTADATGPISLISLACSVTGTPPQPPLASVWVTTLGGATVCSGNLVISVDTFKTPSTTFDLASTSDLLFDQVYNVHFSTSVTDAGNCYNAFYSAPTLPTSGTIQAVSFGNVVQANQQLCCTVVQGGYENSVIAPGIYNLVGQRYITLHCREVEAQLYRDRPFDPFSFGLGKIPLGVFGFQETSYDFSSVPRRTFRPIAKLSQLTLEFIRPDGELYDFKCVDHTMTLLLRFYAPPTVSQPKFVISSTYEADPHALLVRQLQEENDRRWQTTRAQYQQYLPARGTLRGGSSTS